MRGVGSPRRRLPLLAAEEALAGANAKQLEDWGSLMHGHGSTQSTPRWVKVFGIIVIALLLLFASLYLIGSSLLGHVQHSGATEHGLQQP
jgi:hypothetical protein